MVENLLRQGLKTDDENGLQLLNTLVQIYEPCFHFCKVLKDGKIIDKLVSIQICVKSFNETNTKRFVKHLRNNYDHGASHNYTILVIEKEIWLHARF